MLQRKREGERWIKVGAVARESKCKTEKLSSYLSDYLLPQQSCLLLLLLPWWWPTLDHNRTVFLSDALKQAWALWNQIGYVYFSKVVRIFISPTFTWNRWLFFFTILLPLQTSDGDERHQLQHFLLKTKKFSLVLFLALLARKATSKPPGTKANRFPSGMYKLVPGHPPGHINQYVRMESI